MAVDVGTLRIRILSDLSEFMRGMQDVQGKLRSLGSSLQETGRTLSLGVTAPLTALGGVAIKSAIDFESAFAGVRKTVDATEEEFAQLRQGIRDMAKEVPASREEIAAVAEAAGQLGISTENIMSFTRTMIDLGVSTNLSSDQAATALARLANITQMPQDQFDRLGSTIVALGNNLATTEAEIVEMGLRIAGAGAQIGLTEAEILGLAAALSSVGIEAEAGGSAISRVMIQIANAVSDGGDDLVAFAKVAGMTADEFRTAFETDAAGAVIAFIEGLDRLSDSGENVFQILNDLGLKEIRVRDALLRMAGAGDLVRESVELGTEAWEENTALTNEASQRYKTTASQLRILWNRLTDVALTIGDVLLPKLNDLINRAQPLMDRLGALAQKFTELDPKLQNFILVVAGIVAAIGPFLVMLGVVVSALAALSLPIVLVVAGIALLAAGIAALIIWWDDLSARFPILGELLNWLRGQWERLNSWIRSDAIPAFENVMAAVGAVIDFVREHWPKIEWIVRPVIDQFVKIITIALSTVLDIITTTMGIILNVIALAMDILQGDWSGAWQNVKDILHLAVNFILSRIENMKDLALGALELFVNLAIGAFQRLLGGAMGKLGELVGWVSGLPGRILDALGDLGSLLWQAGRDLIQGLIDGIKSMAGAAKEAAKGVVSGVKNAVTGFFGIRSPSTVFMEIGRDLTAGLRLGMERGAAEVARAAEGLAGMTVAPVASGHSPAPLVGAVTINVSAASRDDADAIAGAVDERIRRVLSDIARSQPLIGRQAGRA